jgi:hypothetical protein
MNTTYVETRSTEAGAYGGLLDAIGGIATAVLAIIALSGYAHEVLAGVAIIVFGAALLVQAGTLLTEFASMAVPGSMSATSIGTEAIGGDGVSAMFIVGAAGVVLGILALLGVTATVLTSVAIIAFGAAFLLSAGSARHLHQMQSMMRRGALGQSGSELIAGQMAAGSGGLQMLSGISAIVLGILAVCGVYRVELTLVALLVLGLSIMMTGGSLSGMVLSFMRSSSNQTLS